MTILASIVFAVLAVGTFGFTAYNLAKVWQTIQIGTGADDIRSDRPLERLLGMLKGGLLQPKMLKDIWPAIMHY